MMLATKERPVVQEGYTIEEFEQLYLSPENSNRLLELINGEVREKMPTEEDGYMAGYMITAINNFALPKRLGIAGVEIRHRSSADERNSRLPDVAFNKGKRSIVKQGSVPKMPDLAIEIKSPDDIIQEMRDTAAYYLANGSRLVWLVYPNYRLIEVYRLGADIQILGEEDTLTGGDVLPGFELPVREVFADPLAE